ncbi:hypothetical protein TW95_gp1334 [Pandoravirus inopinatum]|uniref:Uncharacterized protein n=1 Tax=Pandoravirus inopinatum TaxID=1605721 RepID=A0A0B5IYV5_9VIRU|nr:hypothetical protein TW95_gp1334 [Pandoravirus inopinatum]AJF98068.1 hypothetical protein [Pandoravirus inopinatum]
MGGRLGPGGACRPPCGHALHLRRGRASVHVPNDHVRGHPRRSPRRCQICLSHDTRARPTTRDQGGGQAPTTRDRRVADRGHPSWCLQAARAAVALCLDVDAIQCVGALGQEADRQGGSNARHTAHDGRHTGQPNRLSVCGPNVGPSGTVGRDMSGRMDEVD